MEATCRSRAVATQALAIVIEAIHKQSLQTYGSPSGVEELRKQGSRHGRQKRLYRVQNTDSNHTPSLQIT